MWNEYLAAMPNRPTPCSNRTILREREAGHGSRVSLRKIQYPQKEYYYKRESLPTAHYTCNELCKVKAARTIRQLLTKSSFPLESIDPICKLSCGKTEVLPSFVIKSRNEGGSCVLLGWTDEFLPASSLEDANFETKLPNSSILSKRLSSRLCSELSGLAD